MFVYFIQAGTQRMGPIKIGYAANPEKRMVELQVGCPFTLTLLFKLPVKSEKHAQKVEAWYHDRFHRKHIRGEWFKKISLDVIYTNVAYALEGTDWDEVRSRHGGKYWNRGKNRPLNDIEKTNQERIDRLAQSNHEIKLSSTNHDKREVNNGTTTQA